MEVNLIFITLLMGKIKHRQGKLTTQCLQVDQYPSLEWDMAFLNLALAHQAKINPLQQKNLKNTSKNLILPLLLQITFG